MAIGNSQVGEPVVLSASGLVTPGVAMARTYPGGSSAQATQAENTTLSGSMLGFLCNSTSGGTVVLSFATAAGAAGTAFTGTITPAAGTFYPFAASSPTGIFATIAVAALNLTFFVCG